MNSTEELHAAALDDALTRRLIGIIKKSHAEERIQRTVLTSSAEAVIEEAPDDEKAAEVHAVDP